MLLYVYSVKEFQLILVLLGWKHITELLFEKMLKVPSLFVAMLSSKSSNFNIRLSDNSHENNYCFQVLWLKKCSKVQNK